MDDVREILLRRIFFYIVAIVLMAGLGFAALYLPIGHVDIDHTNQCFVPATIFVLKLIIWPTIPYHLMWFDRGTGPERKTGIILTLKILGIVTLPMMSLHMVVALVIYNVDSIQFNQEQAYIYVALAGLVYWFAAVYFVSKRYAFWHKPGTDVTTGTILKKAAKLMLVTSVPILSMEILNVFFTVVCSL